MARFRKRRGRRSFGRFRRGGRRSSGGPSAMDYILAGAIYGVGRPMVANMIPPMFEFGPVDSDNAILGGAAWFGLKKGNKLIKAISGVTLAGEVAQVAAKATSGSLGGNGGTVQY